MAAPNLSDVPTADLLLELGTRCERADKLMALIREEPRLVTPAPSEAARPRRRLLTEHEVLEALVACERPVTAAQLHRRIRRGTIVALRSQLNRAAARGKVRVNAESRPHSYTVNLGGS